MHRLDFTQHAPGRLVALPTPALPDAEVAFIPDPLPPNWEWPTELYGLLVEARAALSSLDGTGKHLKNPEIVLQPIQQREAQLSSQLEGTVTDPAQQVLFQADPRYALSPNDPNNAHREVFNYARALRLRYMPDSEESKLPLSKRLIEGLHGVLMDGVRGHNLRPGEFRITQNYIQRPARYVPPPPTVVVSLMDEFEKYLNWEPPAGEICIADGINDPLVRSFIAHYQFEAIHPFNDGNGRVGRLLLAICIAEWCGLSRPWLYMSPYFERNKTTYMDKMLRVSTHGDWAEWIRFCLRGVISEARDTERRCDRLLQLHDEFVARLNRSMRGGTIRLTRIVNDLFYSPVVTVAGLRNRMKVSYPTAKADLAKLESLGIVRRFPGLPEITYYCSDIFAITYEGIIDGAV